MPTTDSALIRREELSGLIHRVARGDRKALGEVYNRTSAKLYGVRYATGGLAAPIVAHILADLTIFLLVLGSF